MTTFIIGTFSNKRHTDWIKCCLCQQYKRNEALISPTTRYKTQQDGYIMLATNIPLFHAINDMPIILDPSRLDEDEGIQNAKYHTSCHIKFDNTKLARAKNGNAMRSKIVLKVLKVQLRSKE